LLKKQFKHPVDFLVHSLKRCTGKKTQRFFFRAIKKANRKKAEVARPTGGVPGVLQVVCLAFYMRHVVSVSLERGK